MNIDKLASAFKKTMAVGLAAVMLFVTAFFAFPLSVYAGSSVYDIQIIHNGFYGYGVAATLQGSSTDPSKPTYGDRVWVGSAEWDSKCYYEAGSDYLSIKFVLQRNNGSWQPGDNYIYGTVKYDGHTVNINNWGPFTGSNDWNTYSELKMKKRSVTFNYNGGKNPDYQDAPITVTFYDDNNSNNNNITETFSEQPWWTAYGTFGSVFAGWYTEPTGGTKIEEYDLNKLDSSITSLYAHFKPTHLVELVGSMNVTAAGGTIDSYGHIDMYVPQGEPMQTITYTATEGYHFDKFDDIVRSGITVTRVSDKVVQVSGTPTAGVYIMIPDRHKYGEWTKVSDPTCSTPGQEERVCSKDSTIKEMRDSEPINPTAHDWGEWAETTPASCIAPAEETRTCSHNAEHKETREGAPIDTNAHDWGEPTYTWAEDNSSVTAKRVCTHDASHIEEETVETTTTVTQAATCTLEEKTKWTTKAFVNTAFQAQEKVEVTADALDHEWGETTYTWADDNSSVTAKRICNRDASHVEEETVNATSEVVEEPTTTKEGTRVYTATFTTPVFEQQTKTESIAKLEPEIPISYSNTKGEKNSWTEGSAETSDFVFKRSTNDESTLEHFKGIEVDGVIVDESNYETAPGSVIVKLKPEYLKTLEVGNHTITALFDDGNSASAHFSVLAPKASEESEGKQDSTKTPDNKPANKPVDKPANNEGKQDSTKTPDNKSANKPADKPANNEGKQDSTKAPDNKSANKPADKPANNEGKQDSTKAPTNNDNNAEGAIESTKATTNNASDANDSTTAEMLNNNAGNANDSTTAEMLNDNVGNATESTATNTEGGSNVALWLSIMIAAVIGLGIALRPRRR